MSWDITTIRLAFNHAMLKAIEFSNTAGIWPYSSPFRPKTGNLYIKYFM